MRLIKPHGRSFADKTERKIHKNSAENNAGAANAEIAIAELMAYGRKLKNAVSKSIITMPDKEGLKPKWEMQRHELARPKLSAKPIAHLGGAKAIDKKCGNAVVKNDKSFPVKEAIIELRHGQAYVNMAAALFGAERRK